MAPAIPSPVSSTPHASFAQRRPGHMAPAIGRCGRRCASPDGALNEGRGSWPRRSSSDRGRESRAGSLNEGRGSWPRRSGAIRPGRTASRRPLNEGRGSWPRRSRLVAELRVGPVVRSTKAGAHGPGDRAGAAQCSVRCAGALNEGRGSWPRRSRRTTGSPSRPRSTLNEGRGSWPRRSRRSQPRGCAPAATLNEGRGSWPRRSLPGDAVAHEAADRSTKAGAHGPGDHAAGCPARRCRRRPLNEGRGSWPRRSSGRLTRQRIGDMTLNEGRGSWPRRSGCRASRRRRP